MRLNIAFWNINMGAHSTQEKLTTFTNWCNEINRFRGYTLDLLFLEEVGHTLNADQMNLLTGGMVQIGSVETLDVNFRSTSKELRVFAKNGNASGFNALGLRFPELDQRRRLIKVISSVYKEFSAWGIHANASFVGGKNAVTAVNEYLNLERGMNSIIGGDFNLPIQHAGGNVVPPIDLHGNPLVFSQRTTHDPLKATHGPFDPNNPMHFTVINEHKIPHNYVGNSVLDYVIHGNNMQVVPLRNVQNQRLYELILTNFDHQPVAYQLQI